MYKNKIFNDKLQVSDKVIKNGIKKTRIVIRDLVTGEELFRGSNKTIIAGSLFTACKHFNLSYPVTLPSYNKELQLDNSVETAPENLSSICLFAVGTGGCGAEDSQIIDVDYMKWLDKDNIVPFVYRNTSDDLSDEERKKYFGRKTLTDLNKIAYYFKAFESDPELIVQYVDGTPIDTNIYNSVNTTEGEVIVSNRLRVTPSDCREFFKSTVGLHKAKINTISLLQAWYKEVDGKKYFQDIHPVTKFNFETESLVEETKGLDITYDLYY